MQLFMVEYGNMHALVTSFVRGPNAREDAKRKAHKHFGGGGSSVTPDDYTVTPLTEPGDRIVIDITLSA